MYGHNNNLYEHTHKIIRKMEISHLSVAVNGVLQAELTAMLIYP